MESKQRLRPWLEAQINNGEIPGLCWLNPPEKTKFRIPWKHGGKQDWNPDSGQIFKEWARHTGRFREGIDEPDYVKWKTRLRCAFNKAPDIEEVKEESQLEGPDPFRVYILKPRKNGKKTSEPESKANVHSSQHRFQHQQAAAPIPAFLEDIRAMSTESFPSDLKDIKTEDFVKIEGTQMSISNISMDDIVMLSDNFQSLKLGQQKSTTTPDSSRMILKIFYSGNEVMDKTVQSPHGCRLYYSTFKLIPVPDLPEWMMPLVYETHSGDNLCLPPCQDLMNTPKLQSFWQNVLDRGLIDGICLTMHDDDIYALRFCACQLFYVSECGTGGNPVPLVRKKDGQIDGTTALTKIFDYTNAFLPALEGYRAGIGPKPSPTVYLLFGFSKNLHDLQASQGELIYATVTSTKALAALTEFTDGQVISSDEKCASAILHIEALMKAEPSNPEFVIPDFNPETVGGADDEFLDNLFQHGLATFPDVAASADNIEGFSFDESTLDFSDLCHLGIGVSGDKFLEFQ